MIKTTVRFLNDLTGQKAFAENILISELDKTKLEFQNQISRFTLPEMLLEFLS